MTDLAPIRSQKYLDGSRNQPCTFTGPTCCADPATTVFAHLNGAAFGKGMGQKAHDIAGADLCANCHAYVDVGHGTRPLVSDAEFNMLLLRAVVRTMVNRVRRQIIIIPLDPERLSSSKPTPPRKPPAERAKIPTRETQWPKREMRGRNDLRKAKQ